MKRLVFSILVILNSTVLAGEYQPMHVLDINFAEGESLPLSEKISFRMSVSNSDKVYDALSQWQGIEVEVISSTEIAIWLSDKISYQGGVNKRHTQPSFVVDFDEPAVQSLLDVTSSFTGGAGALSKQLERYVHQFITDPTYIHGFNIASVTANNKSGDCTEHAVLLAALARASNIPARVIVGTVIMGEQGALVAYGHAWTEVWYEEQWHVIDAALNGMNDQARFYLPSGALESEGPGFAFSLFSTISAMPLTLDSVTNL